jgi:hypothetical protein
MLKKQETKNGELKNSLPKKIIDYFFLLNGKKG